MIMDKKVPSSLHVRVIQMADRTTAMHNVKSLTGLYTKSSVRTRIFTWLKRRRRRRTRWRVATMIALIRRKRRRTRRKRSSETHVL